jgi:hypothetical protein
MFIKHVLSVLYTEESSLLVSFSSADMASKARAALLKIGMVSPMTCRTLCNTAAVEHCACTCAAVRHSCDKQHYCTVAYSLCSSVLTISCTVM